MNPETLARIRFSQAKDAIRKLAGSSAKEADLRAAAELLAADPQWAGVDVQAALAEILASRARAARDVNLTFACMAIARNAERCAAYLQATA